MKPELFKEPAPGKCIKTLENYWAYIPNPLPPKLIYDEELLHLLSEGDRLVGELKGMGNMLPNPYLLITPYAQREAVSSSQIEGTRASLSDLMLFEAGAVEQTNIDDIQEVRNYIRALSRGVKLLKKMPLSTRFLRELHAVLMKGVRGGHARPGEIRTSQNWIGAPGCTLKDAKYVPPPPREMSDCLSDLEKYIHSEPQESALIQSAYVHYQFEAIHPFLDGNGRIGRLLITLLLLERGTLSQPILYLSGFFHKYRSEYYNRLFEVSQKGAWNEWVKFFLRGVSFQSQTAIQDAKKLSPLHEELVEQVRSGRKMPETAIRIVEELFQNPMLSIAKLSKDWDLPYNSVKNGVERLVRMGLLEEKTGGMRNRIYVCPKLLRIVTQAGD
jgi:Fic family protein